MPDYNPWVALFYSLWYQAGHVNLAYTLTQLIPFEDNPLSDSSDRLKVVDFGCGELAMQFGLALAATDALEKHRRVPQITVFSEDGSDPMREVGWNIWHHFLENTKQYPELSPLREVCRSMEFVLGGDSDSTCWLTAMHVAYKDNAPEVKDALDERIREHRPVLVLVTAHPRNTQWTYSPESHEYRDISDVFSGSKFVLDGEFESTSKLRSDLCHKHILNMLDFLGDDDYWFVRNYLTKYPTRWVTTNNFRTRDFLYRRI